MSHTRKYKHSKLLLDNLSYTGSSTTPTTVEINRYNAEEYTSVSPKGKTNFTSIQDSSHLLWLKVTGLTSVDVLTSISKAFSINQSDLQDILTAEHITKISIDKDSILTILKTFYYNSSREFCVAHVGLLLRANHVITFQESDVPIFASVNKALETNARNVRSKSVDYLYGLLVDCVANSYLEATDMLEQRINDMEEQLIKPQSAPSNIGVEILTTRKSLQRMRRSAIPLKEQLPYLLHTDNGLIRSDNVGYFIDINDLLQLIVQLLESCREEVNSLADLHIANNDLKMNEIMKRLTAVATIFIPLTFVVGLWGMNFKYMPETEWKYGYLFAWIVLAVVAVVTWLLLYKRKWF